MGHKSGNREQIHQFISNSDIAIEIDETPTGQSDYILRGNLLKNKKTSLLVTLNTR